jgi:predicted nucleic acid-binding protein
MGEFIYVAMKGRLRLANPKNAVKQVPDEVWDAFLSLHIPELHDRLIAAESMARGLSLISNDPEFRKLHGLKVIWDYDLSD